jgi:S1-C subfamily serine protease
MTLAKLVAPLLLLTAIALFAFNGTVPAKQSLHEDMDGVVYVAITDLITDSETGAGSGFFIDDNMILTNNHVADPPKEIQTDQFGTMMKVDPTIRIRGRHSDKLYPVVVIARDPGSDLALLRIDADFDPDNENPLWEDYKRVNGLHILRIGDSRLLEEGDEVYSIGHPQGHEWTVSKGIVSAMKRRIMMPGMPAYGIQTDAGVHPGNSGGPLINADGEVVGVNNIMMQVQGGSFGLAIPTTIVKRAVASLLKDGKMDWAILKVSLDFQNTLGDETVTFKDVNADGPAAKAGVLAGDDLLGIRLETDLEWTPIAKNTDLLNYMNDLEPETVVVLQIKRGEEVKEIAVTTERVGFEFYAPPVEEKNEVIIEVPEPDPDAERFPLIPVPQE